MLVLTLTETAKLVPYISSSRKSVKLYLKVKRSPKNGTMHRLTDFFQTCLDLWASAEDDVRIAAFLSVRRVASSSDESLMDLALKARYSVRSTRSWSDSPSQNTYLTLVRACKTTSAHTLPSINLMKNTASELYTMDHAASYEHGFGYIRQLAILLRNGVKAKSKVGIKYHDHDHTH